jgi:hypothetical protein
MTSLFRRDVLEATRMDGAKPQDEFYVLLLSLLGHRLDKPDCNDFCLERSLLESEPDCNQRSAADRFYRIILSSPEGLFAGLT